MYHLRYALSIWTTVTVTEIDRSSRFRWTYIQRTVNVYAQLNGVDDERMHAPRRAYNTIMQRKLNKKRWALNENRI